jgi:signal peptidase I
MATSVTLAVAALLFTAAGLLFFMHLSIQPVLTGSMRPTYGPGWAVISRSIPVNSIRPGMVVIFVPLGQAVSYAHRVVTVTGSPNDPVLTTKGDANPGPDAWHARIKAKSIQEVIWAVPGVGHLMVDAQEPVMTAILISLAGLFVAITGAKSTLRPRSPHPQYPRPLAHTSSTA